METFTSKTKGNFFTNHPKNDWGNLCQTAGKVELIDTGHRKAMAKANCKHSVKLQQIRFRGSGNVYDGVGNFIKIGAPAFRYRGQTPPIIRVTIREQV